VSETEAVRLGVALCEAVIRRFKGDTASACGGCGRWTGRHEDRCVVALAARTLGLLRGGDGDEGREVGDEG
jgi:hypothetical protein